MRDGQHFESVAPVYRSARPAYPDVLFDTLQDHGVIGPGRRVLEIGAGSGQATGELIRRGSSVVAVEPGARLVAQLRQTCPEATVVPTSIETADLPAGQFDSVVAATAMHWTDLPTVLPKLATALRPRGLLAVWRTVYGDPRVRTPFRDAVEQIVRARGETRTADPLSPRPTVTELEADGTFGLVHTWQWPWQIDLSAAQLRDLFSTFSDWTDPEDLDRIHAAAHAQHGPVTEHYVTVLHLLRCAADRTPGADVRG